MATEPKTLYTYADLERFPDDNLRREIIDGDLVVTPAPATRHQRVVMEVSAALHAHAKLRGGVALPAPFDVLFDDRNVVEPDVLYVGPAHEDRVEARFVRSAPDVVVEVSSPSTRRLELIRKRRLYERFGVPEYWYVDLDAERIEIYRLEGDVYGPPTILERGRALESPHLRGFSLAVEDILGPAAPD